MTSDNARAYIDWRERALQAEARLVELEAQNAYLIKIASGEVSLKMPTLYLNVSSEMFENLKAKYKWQT